MKIRLVEEKDYQQVLDILNESIEKRIYTAQLSKANMEDRKAWFVHHSSVKHPMFVIEDDERVIGWVTLTEYRAGREGFRYTSEISYYIDSRYQGKGLGTQMMGLAIEAAREIGFKNLIAVILESNLISIKLAKKHGFELWGRLPGVVDIDGDSISCNYWGLKL
ncbi:MAG: N-acetyltransferase [Eubacteriaceae bacterium]|nr:N-acetyltransferase [Eubacteriaceae bacterium]